MEKALRAILGLSAIGASVLSFGQTVVSGNYSESFDGLASSGTTNTWVQGTSVAEWWAYRFPANPGAWTDVTVYIANNGSTANGSLYSFGPTSSTDRALGSIGSGNDASGAYRYGTGFTNGFSQSINEINMSFRAETWRVGSTGLNHNVEFQYSLGATSVNDNSATWIDFDDLDFTQSTNTTSGVTDGNANFLLKASSLTGLSIDPGDTIWIRWTDIDHGGADHGLAIDDFSATFSTVPEPASLAILGLGLLAIRRRKK